MTLLILKSALLPQCLYAYLSVSESCPCCASCRPSIAVRLVANRQASALQEGHLQHARRSEFKPDTWAVLQCSQRMCQLVQK